MVKKKEKKVEAKVEPKVKFEGEKINDCGAVDAYDENNPYGE